MIVVTGATGFVGSHLVRRLVQRGARPRCLVRRGARLDALPRGEVDVVQGDIVERASLDAAMDGAEAVVHLAAVTANIKQSAGVSYRRVNAEGTRYVVEAARAAGVRRLVHLSGIGAQPGGEHSWIRTRWLGEEAVRGGSVPYTILRPSVLFGGRGAEFFQAQVRVLRFSPVAPILGDGQFRFQPLWVEDLCTCILTALEDPTMLGRAVAIGGPEVFTYRQIMDLLLQTLHMRRPTVTFPLGLMRLGAQFMEAALPRPPLTTATLELFSLGDNVAEGTDIVPRLFGFPPASLRDYLREHGV